MSRDLQWDTSEELDTRHRRRSPRSFARRAAKSWFAQQTALAVLAYFAYFLVRGFTEGGTTQAITNAGRVMELERDLGFFWERAWQSAMEGSDLLVWAGNAIYMYGHWPVIIGVAIWLGAYHRSRFVQVRNAFLISGAIGLVIFALFPTAPPRLVPNLEIVDTITVHTNSYRLLQPPALTNQYAAVPSLHLGWNMLIGLAVFLEASRRIVRFFAVLLPVLMFFAVVVTGNHFIFDSITGIIVSLIGLWVAILIGRRGARAETRQEVAAS